jgi:hypothetical protein
MSSAPVIKNKFDGNDYRVSIIPARKRASIPNPLERALSDMAGEKKIVFKLARLYFDNIIFEAAIFPKKRIFKPLFIIALNDGYSKQMTEEEFTKFVHHIMANEKTEDLMNGVSDIYEKYGSTLTFEGNGKIVSCMKHASKIRAEKKVADVYAPKKQTECKPEPAADVDAVMEEIHMRADYIGPVLEEILKTGRERVGWARYV